MLLLLDICKCLTNQMNSASEFSVTRSLLTQSCYLQFLQKLYWIRVGSSSWIVCDRGLLFFDRSRDYILIEVVTNTFHDFSSVNERVLPVVVIDRPKNSIRRDGYKLEYFRFIAKPKFWGTKLSVLHLLNNLSNDFPIKRMSSKRITKRISYIVNICEDSWSRTKSDHRNLKYSPKEPWSETRNMELTNLYCKENHFLEGGILIMKNLIF